jgi:hypothetical protein
MVVALPLMDRVAGVAVEALAGVADETNTADENNTVVMTLDSLMRLLLAERLPYVAERRHFVTTSSSGIATGA